MRGGVHNHPSAHTVASNGDAMRVHAESRGVRRIAEIREDGVGVLEVLSEAEHTRTAPRAAIIECDGVPAGAPDGLREIEIFFVSWQAVANDESGVRPGAGGLVDDAINLHAVSWDVEDGHFGRMSCVGGRVGEDGGRNGLSRSSDRGK